MIEDSPNMPRMPTNMENEQALLIRNLEDIGVVVYNRGVNSGRNPARIVEHFRNTINGNGRPLIVILTGIRLNDHYYNSANIVVGVGNRIGRDGSFLFHNHGEIVAFLAAIITPRQGN
jgi:hypothetical protein